MSDIRKVNPAPVEHLSTCPPVIGKFIRPRNSGEYRIYHILVLRTGQSVNTSLYRASDTEDCRLFCRRDIPAGGIFRCRYRFPIRNDTLCDSHRPCRIFRSCIESLIPLGIVIPQRFIEVSSSRSRTCSGLV